LIKANLSFINLIKKFLTINQKLAILSCAWCIISTEVNDISVMPSQYALIQASQISEAFDYLIQ
jgi:hypothetical protein